MKMEELLEQIKTLTEQVIETESEVIREYENEQPMDSWSQLRYATLFAEYRGYRKALLVIERLIAKNE